MPNVEIVSAAPLERSFCASAPRIIEDPAWPGACLRVLPAVPSHLLRGRRRARPFLAALLCAAALLSGCGLSGAGGAEDDIVPQNLYMFAPLQAPAAPTGVAAAQVDLGRRLYYDTHLSRSNTLSCNSCHQLAKYGIDPGQSTSDGWEGKRGGRNSPTVYNAGLQFVQFWDGRAPTLAAQASGPMMNPVEMGMPAPEVVLAYLQADPSYEKHFQDAYPGMKQPITMDTATAAIATFESGLITPSRWDAYLRGDVNILSPHEKEGLRVFLHDGCASCHAGRTLGGISYAKLGAVRPWPDTKSDPGRFAVTGAERDRMVFKVPMLRNVERTGPWFHNGQVMTLDEAVRLMAVHQTGRSLSPNEVDSILAFLHTLTGRIPVGYIEPPSQATPAAAATHPGAVPPRATTSSRPKPDRGE